MKNLIEAVLKVMEECEGIEKSMNVGSGRNTYKGVSDKDVKVKVGQSMRKHGLIILPTKITPQIQIDRWEETQVWNGQEQKKQKQSVFTEVVTDYLLCHKSGETVTLSGYGHGVDSQDKGAGKATTYALKYTLLYSFLVATGHIDDADNTHSNDIDNPKPKSIPQEKDSKPLELEKNDPNSGSTTPKEKKFIQLATKEGGMTKKLAGFISKARDDYKWSGERILELLDMSDIQTTLEEIKNS